MATSTLYWIWLGGALGYGSHAIKPLLEAFGDAEGVFHASPEEIAGITAVCSVERQRLLDHDLGRAEEVAGYCLHGGIRILNMSESEYPAALLSIHNPPVVLYCRGALPDWNRVPCIGMVGARAMSHYGADAACEIAYDLGRMGCITVSGMALGIDGVAAAATIEAGGKTVAVLGSGIDRVYPKEHRNLYQSILKSGGTVITEFPPYEGADGFHFPLRNRIISALSQALIVVEGESGSGALITARYAQKQGRCVFAVPGKIRDKNSEAPLLLLKQDAKVLTCADDVYDTFKEKYFSTMNPFALLPKVSLNMEAIVRKYGVAAGREKPKPKRLLGSDPPKTTGGFLQKMKNLFGSDAEKEEENTPLTEQASEKDRENARRLLDEKRKNELSAEDYSVYRCLNYDLPSHPDEITVEDMRVSDISSILVALEVLGCVTITPGGGYLKNEF